MTMMIAKAAMLLGVKRIIKAIVTLKFADYSVNTSHFNNSYNHTQRHISRPITRHTDKQKYK